MIPYAVDPSLHPAQPEPPQLDDGFSAPRKQGGAAVPRDGDATAASLEEALADKSDF